MCDESDLNQVSPTMDEFLSLEPPALVSADQLGKLEVCAGGSGDGFSSAVETFLCHICNMRYQQPRVLQCLHVFCTPCLEKLTSEENLKENGIVEIQSLSTRDSVSSGKLLTVTCPACRQDTHIETSVAELPLDVVTMNAMDIADIQALRMQCTSCKADERAVARCSDCASFLCANCVTAHKYMRLFENHKVESFDVLQKGDGISIHKPFFCSLHPIESVKFFCISCQIPVCSECILCAHKSPDHVCDRIADIETKQIEELQNLVAETRAKVAHCENASANLETVLSELQQQRDVAHDLIKESYQSYKSILEKRKDELLKELDMIHSAGELSIMDMYHAIEKAIEQMDTACQFTDRILSLGNGVEVLSMKKLVVSQMLSLINSVPCLETASPIEFLTDSDVFAAAVKATFGNFGKPGNKNCVSSPPSCPPSSLSIGGDGTAQPADRASGSPASPEMMAMLMRSGSIPGLPAVVGMGQQNVNLQQMMVERGMPRSSVSTGGQSSDGVTSANTSSLHMSALAKIGPNFVTNVQGQLPLSSQAVLGMNLNNSAAALVRANLAQRINVPVQTSTDTAAIAGLLNSVMLTPSPPASVPPAGELGNLLNSVSGGPLSTSVGVLQTGHPVSAAAVAAIAAAANIRPVPAPHLPANGGTALSIQPTVGPFGLTDESGTVRSRSSGKVTAMQIRCKFGQLGPGKGQFNSPHGFCLGMDEDIVVADTNNHRVQIFDKTGEFKYQFGIPGREEGQLWYPRKVAVIRTSGKYVVCDRGSERSRMQIFTKTGQFIKKIAIRYIDIVAGLAITSQGHIVAVDSVSPTVFCISETGDLIRWFDCSDYMREPSDIAISGKEYFVCDFKGHCVVVFNEDGQFLHRIGCENITNYPNGIDISDAGDVLIGDSHGNRFHIAVFQRDGSLIGEFECPYVKVSRCCGLKITSEGYVVTLAKNNQHVLVLNTLYIA